MQTTPLEIRDLRFDLGERVPRHWHPAGRSVSNFFDNLSVFFPHGERFFVRSVRARAHRIEDPALAREVKAFCGQEGVHSREHVRYNKMLAQKGYPVVAMEARVDRLLKLVMRVVPRRSQLAATCALEHFTALMGHMILEDPRSLEGAHPTMAALWRWHAAEENEHKSLAFDVYRTTGGNNAERAWVMIAATVIFWAKVLEQQARMMHADGILFSASEWAALGRFLFVDPGGMQKLLVPYLAYFHPGFHPTDIDDGALLEAWRKSYQEGAALGRAE